MGYVEKFQALNIHKQYVNRLIEPWMWVTIIASATDWANLFAQRYHHAAEPSFQKIAKLIWESYNESTPVEMDYGQWHLPLADSPKDNLEIMRLATHDMPVVGGSDAKLKELFNDYARQVCVGRCAGISYGKQDKTVADAIALHDKLIGQYPGHWSPFEHAATPAKPEVMKWRLDQLEYREPHKPAFYKDESRPGGIFPIKGEMGYCGAYEGWQSYRHTFTQEYIRTFIPPIEEDIE
jgi:hypothetical protein